MAQLAFCNGSKKIWQIDTTSALVPAVRHDGDSNIRSLAPHMPGELAVVWGPGSLEVRQTKANTDVAVYKHTTHVRKVRVRDVAGQERIYFTSAPTPGNLFNLKIHYLNGDAPVLYYSVDINELTVPNPCVEGETIPYYVGDFAFGSDDTLYLSTGNVGGLLQAGVYKVTGAGPDAVTGTVTRIYLGEGPIEGLCFVAPNILYFLRSDEIFSLNLTSLTEQFEYQVTGLGRIVDLAQAPAGKPSFFVRVLVLSVFFRLWERVYVGLRTLSWGRGWRSGGTNGGQVERTP